MRKILFMAFMLLVAGCSREDEKDWIIGKWEVVSCTYVNNRTGEKGDCSPGFKTWEFIERGNVFVDDGSPLPYWHKNGHVSIDGTIYDEVSHGRDRMQLQYNSVAGVTTYTFIKVMQ